MSEGYAQWKLEQKHLRETGEPFPASRRHDRPGELHLALGYWRQRNARTLADTPVAIWPQGDAIMLTFGAKRESLQSTVPEHDQAIVDFMSRGYLKCEAVTRDEWSTAIDMGKWADGKRIRKATAEEIAHELADIIPSGDNSREEGRDLFYEQVKEKLDAAMSDIRELGAIDTLDKANAVAEILEPARAVWKLGEQQRIVEKTPHDNASDAVQAKWSTNLLKPASDLFRQANDDAVEMGRRETVRLRQIEADRLAEEGRKAADLQRQQAAQMGMEDHGPSDAEIEAQAATQAARSAPAVRVGTTRGKALSAPKVAKAVITDPVKFFAAVKNDPNIRIALQKKANALARAKHTVEGMELQ